MATEVAANPFCEITSGQRSLLAKGWAAFERDDHDFNILMPAAGLFVQLQDTLPKCPDFYRDVARSWRKYGRLTDRQVVAVMHGFKRCPLLTQAIIDLPDPEPEFEVQYSPTGRIIDRPDPGMHRIPTRLALQDVPPGFYTLGDDEGHITIRVKKWTPAGEDRPKIIVAALVGPHNTTDYQSFATIEHGEIQMWNRFRRGYDRWRRAVEALFTGDYKEYGYQFALQSNHCYRCGAVLTVPASVKLGLGPDCAEKVGY